LCLTIGIKSNSATSAKKLNREIDTSSIMWPFESKETREVKKSIRRMTDYVISQIPKDQLISVYVGGRILTTDRIDESDIDIITIVSDDFDINKRKEFKNYFAKHPEITGGRKGGVWVLWISDFEGRTKKSKILPTIIKQFCHGFHKYLYGKRIDFDLFPIESSTDIEELHHQLLFLRQLSDKYEANDFTDSSSDELVRFPYIAKVVLHVARMEVIITQRMKYEFYFYKIKKRLKKDKNHIFHTGLAIRHGLKMNKKQRKDFITWVRKYCQDIEDNLLKS
jgi:hypothetical protein